MKHLKYLLVGGLVLIMASSYTTKTSTVFDGIYPGNRMPDIAFSDESGNKTNLSELKGQKILVNFWAAYDADSHMKNVLLWNTLRKADLGVKMISVSFDQSRSVFEKTLRIDGLMDSQSQFCETLGKNSDIFKDYKLENGFKNYLIDENGIILAINVNPADLSKY
ncbi:TlpA family protein disulfide reductase [Dysgonomonas sp. 216]|uniref:TlpA family protein disulfide reductase n=1 Tax=Dysgonomonas sp. 216 TaxID=2302934 RepID=UPI0013D3A5F2|nr:redoxin family protein [Dysgonomonas sp. 216]NDW18871.1 TlpA family protein disulfide reductase [Dysgonomonas sp. 216]